MKIKIIIPFILLVSPTFVSSQTNGSVMKHENGINLENLGKDNSCLLNEDESKFLNILFSQKRESFDFTGKKCFFLGGSGGGLIKEKNFIFRIANLDYSSWWEKGCQLIILNEEESSDNGYDAVIVIWSKRIISKKYALKKIRYYLAKKKKS